MKKYICPECGNEMVFEDPKFERFLVCEHCSYSCNTEDYGKTEDDEYDDIYPFEDNIEEDEPDEMYDEVYDELSHALDD